MKRILIFLLCATSSLAGDTAPKRAHQIEEKFHVMFIQEETVPGTDVKVWQFWFLNSHYHLGSGAFMVPVDATDKQVTWALYAVAFESGWYEGLLEMRKKADPSPTPKGEVYF